MPAAKIRNRTIFVRDNLEVLRRIPDKSVALIYLDPPFNKSKTFAAPIGSRAAGAAFKDTWTLSDTDNEWWGEIAEIHPALYSVIHAAGEVGGKSDKAYLIYMAVRLLEMHRILKDNGSLYYHCDPTMSHAIKVMLDAIFGRKNFRGELVWHYKNASRGTKSWAHAHDIIHWHSKSKTQWIFNREEILQPYESGMTKWRYQQKGLPAPKGKTPDDVLTIPGLNAMDKKERLGYPTQKPRELLIRLIKAASNSGDLVLDPFCGCATTCEAAEFLQRKWIGIDISPRAGELIKQRLTPYPHLNPEHDVVVRSDLPGVASRRSRNIKHILYGQQEGVCNGCRHHFPFVNFEIDHIVPVSKGGGDDDENLQLLCGHCNRVKSDDTMADLRARLRRLQKK